MIVGISEMQENYYVYAKWNLVSVSGWYTCDEAFTLAFETNSIIMRYC